MACILNFGAGFEEPRPQLSRESRIAPSIHRCGCRNHGQHEQGVELRKCYPTSTPFDLWQVFEDLPLSKDTHAKIHEDPVELHKHHEYPDTDFDYVIVGAGNAGLVLANRLTEDASTTVLVLEAGVSDQGVVSAIAPFLAPQVTPNTPFDWNYTITPQSGLDGRTFPYPRGKLLGGCSSANYLLHQFGSIEDWDRIANISDDPGWAWNNMRQYVQKHEKFQAPIDGHNTTGQFIPSLHGFKGEVSVSLPVNNQTIDSRVINTTQQLPEFPFNEDTSGIDRSLLGTGWIQSSAGGGMRSSSSTSYLAQANGRPNLTVLIHATVTKLVHTSSSKGVKAFRGVQFTRTPGSSSSSAGYSTVEVKARKEVILSAGSVGTAQVLQLSGIGNSEDLDPLNIPVLVNIPSVGRNFSDHTLLPNLFNVNGDDSFDHILRDPTLFNAAIAQWTANKTGLISNPVANHFGFARIPANSSVLNSVSDPAAGPESPHFEFIFTNFWLSPGTSVPAEGSFMTAVTVLISPTSRGTIKIRSTNPFEQPLIDPNYLTTDFDIFVMRESVRAMLRFVSAPAWDGYVIGPAGNFSSAMSDDEIDAYVRGLMTTIFHPAGTAGMAAEESKTGVVNPDLTVKGIDGLRIVDASVFPFIPSSHTQGPVYILAERAADIIKGDQKN
ncbi:hypothetical protein BDZ97DRAFT_1920652 [Flammula alnicola]|nr:hypothetical protein BDZ97DRAFT_1920652 [Flammula alnicola]